MRAIQQIPGTMGTGDLSVALIGPDERRRKAVAGALAEYQTGAQRDPRGLGRGPGAGARPDEPSLPARGAGQVTTVSASVSEFSSYPDTLDDLPRMLQQNYDIVIVDLDS